MKILLIGCNFGKNYAVELKKLGHKVHSIVTETSGHQDWFERELGYYPERYDSIRKPFLYNGEYDLAIVSTPPATHAYICDFLLGKVTSIIVDKPFTTNQIDSYGILADAQEKGTRVFCNYTCLEDKDMAAVLEGQEFDFSCVAMNFGGNKPGKFPIVYDWLVHNLSLCVNYLGMPRTIEVKGGGEVIESKLDYSFGYVSIRNSTGWEDKVRNIILTKKNGEVINFSQINGKSHGVRTKETITFHNTSFPIYSFLNKLLNNEIEYNAHKRLIQQVTYLNEMAAKSLITQKTMKVSSKDVLYA